MRELRFDVDSIDQLRALVGAALPLGLRSRRVVRRLHRDLYLDTPDDALRRRGIICRFRLLDDGRRVFSMRVSSVTAEGSAPRHRVYSARVNSDEPIDAVRARNTVARRLRGVVDPRELEVRVALEVERFERTVGLDWMLRPRWCFRFEQVTVRDQRESRSFQQLVVRHLGEDASVLERAGATLRDTHNLHPLYTDTRERAQLIRKWMQDPETARRPRRRDLVSPASREWPDGTHTDSGPSALPRATARRPATSRPAGQAEFLNSEIGHLEFISRVLSLAEDRETPLGERLRYLAIVASSLDEFFMVRVAGLMHASEETIEEQAEDGLSPDEQLELISLRVPTLVARQSESAKATLAELAETGTQVRRWENLDASMKGALRERFVEEIYPELTPLAVTLSPGHPIPRLQHLSLALAAMMTDPDGGRARFVNIELPARLPRFLSVTGPRDLVALEDVIRANLDVVYPDSLIEEAYLFRVTRGGEMSLDERQGDDLLDIVSEATKQRSHNPVVRVEVERAMPATLRHLVLEELRRERGSISGGGATENGAARDRLASNVYEVDSLLDLRGLASLPLPDTEALHYPIFDGADPFPTGVSIWETIRERDRLVHHPFESFDATVLRLLREAATDPDVTAIKITLYRTGDDSPVAHALLDAAARGKDVIAFVELKARFDEERNVNWARTLERAGGRVVYGLVGLKNHAKVLLVVRREDDGDGDAGGGRKGKRRRYVHVGTGNYNATTARAYTDLSLCSADPSLTADIADFFNELTGSSKPPKKLTRGALVAPKQMRRALVDRIEREAAHARAGRPAAIKMKMNGLSDPDIVRALYEAARAGVSCNLVVRGICTLRPGIAGTADRLRVVSLVGRFLEHSRAYYFANGGDPEYFIGSADLRSRNLRRRVELLAPVRDAQCRATLDRVLSLYFDDPAAWRLQPHGGYQRGARPSSVTQETLMAESYAGRSS
jgi:polyphosphate kinase